MKNGRVPFFKVLRFDNHAGEDSGENLVNSGEIVVVWVVYIHVYIHVCVYICIYMYIYTIRIYVYIYIYIYISLRRLS